MRLLVSACLLGLCTRFDGQARAHAGVLALRERHTLIPVCPEQLAGLSTPRPPSEIKDGRVMNIKGEDLTEVFSRGAEQALTAFRLCGCEAAVLKRRSPSCGTGPVYDGSFSGRLTAGDGLFAARLLAEGILVYGEDETGLVE